MHTILRTYVDRTIKWSSTFLDLEETPSHVQRMILYFVERDKNQLSSIAAGRWLISAI